MNGIVLLMMVYFGKKNGKRWYVSDWNPQEKMGRLDPGVLFLGSSYTSTTDSNLNEKRVNYSDIYNDLEKTEIDSDLDQNLDSYKMLALAEYHEQKKDM